MYMRVHMSNKQDHREQTVVQSVFSIAVHQYVGSPCSVLAA